MPSYGVNELVRVQIDGHITAGKLVDINMRTRQFKVETEHGSFWINQSQITSKIK